MARRVAVLLTTLMLGTGLGAAAVIGGSSTAGAAGPVAFTILLTADPECQLATVDLTSGLVTATSDPASGEACVTDLTETSDGRVFGIREEGAAAPTVHLVQFNTTTGTPTDLGAIGASPASLPDAGGEDGGIAFDAPGNLFVAMVGDDASCSNSAYCLYKVDLANPANATFVGVGTLEIVEQALTAACDGRAMILAANLTQGAGGAGFQPSPADTPTTTVGGAASPPVHPQNVGSDAILNARSLADGSMTPIGTGVGLGNDLTGLEFDTAGTLWGIGTVSSPGPVGATAIAIVVFTVDPTTGVATSGAALNGGPGGIPIGLALPLSCPTPPVLVAAFTG